MQDTSTKGTHMQSSRNLAASAGRWSAKHRKTAILGWLAFVVIAFTGGGAIGTQNLKVVGAASGHAGVVKMGEDAGAALVDAASLLGAL